MKAKTVWWYWDEVETISLRYGIDRVLNGSPIPPDVVFDLDTDLRWVNFHNRGVSHKAKLGLNGKIIGDG